MRLVRVRKHNEDTLLCPGVVCIKVVGGYAVVQNTDGTAQREGIRSRDGNPAGGLRGRRARKLFLHVENETVGNIHVPGIDEGAASRTQDNIRMGDGEGGGVDRAAAGDFQSPVFQGHGSVLPQVGITEDYVMFQNKGTPVESGLSLEVIITAGNQMGIFPLVELPAEDDRAACGAGIVAIHILVDGKGDVFPAGTQSRTGDGVVETDLPAFGSSQLNALIASHMDRVGDSVFHGEGTVRVPGKRAAGHVAAEKNVTGQSQELAGTACVAALHKNGPAFGPRVIAGEGRSVPHRNVRIS